LSYYVLPVRAVQKTCRMTSLCRQVDVPALQIHTLCSATGARAGGVGGHSFVRHTHISALESVSAAGYPAEGAPFLWPAGAR